MARPAGRHRRTCPPAAPSRRAVSPRPQRDATGRWIAVSPASRPARHVACRPPVSSTDGGGGRHRRGLARRILGAFVDLG